MNPATEGHYVLPASVPTALVYALAAAAVVAWVVAHLAGRRLASRPARAAAFAARVLVGFAALTALWQALQRGLVLATNWPLWPIALLGAVAVETVVALYTMERRTVSRRAGLALVGLRAALVALVVVMLAQPVRPWELNKTLQRFVAVLMDHSASMHVADTQLTPAEKIRLADRFAIEGVRRPYALEASAQAMDRVRADLAAQGEWLASLAGADADARRSQLQARREGLLRALEGADQTLVDQTAALARPLDGSLKLDDRLRAALEDARKHLAGDARDRLAEAMTLVRPEAAKTLDRDHGRLLDAVRQAAALLADAASKTSAAAQAVDEAAYASLPDAQRVQVNALAARKRVALARDALLHRPPAPAGTTDEPGPSLLGRLQESYAVKVYTFASAVAEVDVKAWAEAYHGTENPAAEAAALPAEQQQTDLAAALDKVMTEMSDKELSGLVLVTDGRHNAAKAVEPLVQRLAVQRVPVASLVLGSDKPPLDAGIIAVEAPEALAAKDRMLVNVDLKLDGLAGKEVQVSLLDGDKAVDTKTVRVPSETFRTRVALSDEPAATGIHPYRIEVQKFDGEVIAANNQYPLAVSVTDDRTKVLLVEGRPRWEFRYIKNLFAGRDRTVRLQHVLFDPDRIEGVPTPPKVEASVSRPIEDVEANALPKDEVEWMKFDVVILGDPHPKNFGEEPQRILRKFVLDRGGTLIVIAGPHYMPHAYAATPLADMLPVVFQKADQPVMQGPEKSFRIALTAEGRDSVIMRQKVDPQENQEIWDSLPEVHWRHPILFAKEGAAVLAYALPPSPPDFLAPRAGAGDAAAAPVPDDVLQQRREFERRSALIAHHSVAMGQVMFLSFDHTWRFRYRVGDTYHHRFWGQVLRWATANKLPAGTETVKLGTDRSRYAPTAPVRVRAKIAQKDFTPIKADDVSVTVYAGDQPVIRKKMQYVEESPGLYVADLGVMASGTYRAELDAPAARPVLAEENVEKVSAEFSVEAAIPAEQAELTPDRGLLARLASLTGGTTADPAHADRILASLGKPTEVQVERHEYVLWDSWPLMALLVLLATAEWLLRKKVGLA